MKSNLVDEKGSTLMIVIITFSVLFIFTLTGLFIVDANRKQTVREENSIQAFYVAQTALKSFVKSMENLKDKGGNEAVEKKLNDLSKLKGIKSDFNINGESEERVGSFVIDVDFDKQGDSYRATSIGEVNNIKKKVAVKFNTKVNKDNKPEKTLLDGNWDGTIRAYDKITFDKPDQFVTSKDIKNSYYPNRLILETSKKRNKEEVEEGIFFKDDKGFKVFFLKDNLFKKDLKVDIHGRKMQIRGVPSTYPESDEYQIYDVESDKAVTTLRYEIKETQAEKNFKSNLNNSFDLIGVNQGKISKNLNANEYGKQTEFLKELKRIRGLDTQNQTNIIDSSIKSEKIEFTDAKIKSNNITKTPLVLDIDVFEVKEKGKIEIQTLKDRDIVVVTKNFVLLENANIYVTGDGVVNFFILDSADLQGKGSSIINKTGSIRGVNFFLKPNKQFQINNGSKLEDVRVYGPSSNFQLGDNSWFTGQAIVNTSTIKDDTNIRPSALVGKNIKEQIDANKGNKTEVNLKDNDNWIEWIDE